jgi:sec-independent protein translocase protein TatB
MFEVGFTEILLIFGIALLVLGPERLPKLAADVGRWAGRARSMARQLRTQLEQEVQFDPLQDPVVSQPAASNTIHTGQQPAPEDTRAAPAQFAADVPPPAASTTDLDPAPVVVLPTPDLDAPDARSRPEMTPDDRRPV